MSLWGTQLSYGGPSRAPAVQVSFGAAGAGTSSSAAGSITPAYPSSITAGMVLIAHVIADNSPGAASITAPTGWTSIAGWTLGTVRCEAFYKIADGSESGTLSITCGDANGALARVHRFSAGSGIEAGAQNNSAASSVTCSNVNVTTTQTLECAVQLYAVWSSSMTGTETMGNSTGESGADYTNPGASFYRVAGFGGLEIQTATVAAAAAITGGSAALSVARTNHINIGFAILP